MTLPPNAQLSSTITTVNNGNWLCHSRHRLDGNYTEVDRVDEALEHGPKILIQISEALDQIASFWLYEKEFANCAFEWSIASTCLYFCLILLGFMRSCMRCETDNCSKAPPEMCKTRSGEYPL
jgi:hypothetical protein